MLGVRPPLSLGDLLVSSRLQLSPRAQHSLLVEKFSNLLDLGRFVMKMELKLSLQVLMQSIVLHHHIDAMLVSVSMTISCTVHRNWWRHLGELSRVPRRTRSFLLVWGSHSIIRRQCELVLFWGLCHGFRGQQGKIWLITSRCLKVKATGNSHDLGRTFSLSQCKCM